MKRTTLSMLERVFGVAGLILVATGLVLLGIHYGPQMCTYVRSLRLK